MTGAANLVCLVSETRNCFGPAGSGISRQARQGARALPRRTGAFWPSGGRTPMNKNDRSVELALANPRKKKKFWVFVTLRSFSVKNDRNDRTDTFRSFDADTPMNKNDRSGQLSLLKVWNWELFWLSWLQSQMSLFRRASAHFHVFRPGFGCVLAVGRPDSNEQKWPERQC